MKRLIVILSLAVLAGCDSGALETGYRPRKLTDSATERQAYYASPYSPEASQASNSSPDPALRRPSRY